MFLNIFIIFLERFSSLGNKEWFLIETGKVWKKLFYMKIVPPLKIRAAAKWV